MGQLKKFATSRVSFWLGKCHFFFEKKNSFKIGLTVYASVPLRWFTQVCPCVKRKDFFCFFLKIACTFALRTQKRKEPEKKYLGLMVYASVPLRENWNCLFFCFTCRKKERAKKNIFFTRCGLSSTYHLVPLTLLQYDTKPTRQYDSIMLIHDSLDTEVFSITSALYRMF